MKLLNNKNKLVFSAITAILAGVTILTGTVNAGGPANRPTFTSAKPADYVVFNAITDNPEHGDERNFVLLRDKTAGGKFVDELQIVPGHTYEVYNYFHNNAKSSLNTAENGSKGMAKDVKMSVQVPSQIKPGEKGKISAIISSSNANPKEVWDEAYLTTTSAVAMRYVPASAKIHSGGAVGGSTMSENLFSSGGTYLGWSSLNGVMPGCADFAGYVTYDLVADQPNFEMSKKVSSGSAFVDSIKSKPGAEIQYKVSYKNTGTMNQNNVVMKDTLPKGVSLVKGSGVLTNSSNPNGKTISDDMFTNGINIGNYGPNSEATVTYKLKIAEAKDLTCGVNKLKNIAKIETENGSKEDTADVEVDVECKPDECKPGIPNGSPECEDEKCEVPGKENLKPNDPNCKSTLPAELPKTGPMEAIMVIIALTAISAGVAYWYRSREEVKKATMMASGDKTKMTPKVDEKVEQKNDTVKENKEVKEEIKK